MDKLLKLVFIALVFSSCGGGNGEFMKILAERDSLKSRSEVQQFELDLNKAVIRDINATLDSIAREAGMLFYTGSKEVVTKADALKNLNRFQAVINHQREKIAYLQAQLDGKQGDDELRNLVEHLENQLKEKDAQIAMLKEELNKKDVSIAQLKRMVDTQRSTIEEQNEAIAQLDRKNKAQNQALANQDQYINTCYVLIGTKDDLKRKGVIKGSKLQPDAVLDKSKFAKVDIRSFREISFEAKRPRILTDIPPSAYTLSTTGKRQYILRIDDANAFWSISNFLIIQTD